jgi:ArsR family transcriptional regulator
MKIRNYDIFKLHAEYCRTFANPKRLMILALLTRRELSVGEIADSIGVSMATASQHLSLLRSKHIVDSRRDGQTVYYRPTDPRLMEACRMIRTVLLDGMKLRGEIAQEIDPDDLVVDD